MRALFWLLTVLVTCIAPVLLAGFLTAVVLARIVILLNAGPTLEGIELLLVGLILPIFFLINYLLSKVFEIFWMLVSSFYLPLREWKYLFRQGKLKIPLITPATVWLYETLLRWKTQREQDLEKQML